MNFFFRARMVSKLSTSSKADAGSLATTPQWNQMGTAAILAGPNWRPVGQADKKDPRSSGFM